MPDEGTPGKDSVRALLMPGEFVMTTDAVKGLGGGNLIKGINNMYTECVTWNHAEGRWHNGRKNRTDCPRSPRG